MSKNKKTAASNDTGRGSAFFRFAHGLLSGAIKIIFNVKIVNPENEPDEGRYIVCANHVSATDPIVICYAFKKHQVHYMAKKELFKIPVLSTLIRMLGAFPIDRSGSDVGAIKTAVSIVDSGKCLGIFPQGHRYPGEDPRKTATKNGAALVAARTSADVVPVYLWRKNNDMKLFGRTYVIIGEKIPFEALGYDKDESGAYAKMTEKIFDRICTLGESFDPEEWKKAGK